MLEVQNRTESNKEPQSDEILENSKSLLELEGDRCKCWIWLEKAIQNFGKNLTEKNEWCPLARDFRTSIAEEIKASSGYNRL